MIKLFGMTLIMALIASFIVPGVTSASIAPPEAVSACEQEAIQNGATSEDMTDYVNPCLEDQGFSPLAKSKPLNLDVIEAQEVIEGSSDNQ